MEWSYVYDKLDDAIRVLATGSEAPRERLRKAYQGYLTTFAERYFADDQVYSDWQSIRARLSPSGKGVDAALADMDDQAVEAVIRTWSPSSGMFVMPEQSREAPPRGRGYGLA